MLLPLVSYYLVGKVPVPDSIVIDPINICNLHCPLCPTGLGMQNYEGHAMPLDMFKSIIGKLPRLKKIGLYNWGEPFLNPDIFDMISYAEERNVEVSIHTNFSLKMNSAFFVNIVKSNLSRLTVSLDGASQETYSKYRIGGDYELAIANIRALVAAKKQCMSKTPVITWQFIVNRFNESEIKKAEEMAAAIGIDFSATGIGLSDDLPDLKLDASIGIRKEAWLPTNKEFIIPWYRGEYKKPLMNMPCGNLFESLVITSDGKVFPCCYLSDKKEIFGDLAVDTISDIWNNDKYSYSRSLFTGRKYTGPKVRSVCSECNNYRKKGKA